MKRIRVAGAMAAVAALAAASAAVAGNRAGSESDGVAPMSEHVRASAAGYQVEVHPAFSSAVTVTGEGGDVAVYTQRRTVDLPAGQTAPPARHVVRLQGGASARDVGLEVNDPKHQIARITVELYAPDHQPGRGGAVTEKLVVENDAKTCPPYCGGGTQ